MRRGRTAPDPVLQYDEVAAGLLAGRHGVCSPLGAWLLLALIADSATGDERADLTSILGCDPAGARTRAITLLRDPHPDVAAAVALWFDTATGTGIPGLAAAISPPATVGPVPDQAGADRWATESSRGLVESFPIATDAALAVLATALATRISWREPYPVAAADELRRPPHDPAFAGAALLRAPASSGSAIVAGRYGVHWAWSPRELVVVSAIGDPGDDPGDVLAVARRSAVALARDEQVPATTSLFDLPLGTGPAWELGEELGTGDPQRFETLLPAWRAGSRHDLLAHPALGFDAAGRALASLLPPGPAQVRAAQAAVARYTRTGFDAAAITALAVTRSAMVPRRRPVRTARLEFTHPYAVVAATGGAGPWRGLPVFDAWIAEPTAPS